MGRLLLTSVCQPFGEAYGDGFGTSYEGTHQLLWAQGIFRPRATTTQWGLDFIAENLETPTVVLHYPTLSQLIAELKRGERSGGYDHVGIAFVAASFHKVPPMVAAIRRYAPNTKIVFGGYGTVMDADLESLADYICRGEGVAYMRRLLGERVDAPLKQPDVAQHQEIFSIPLLNETGYIFAGLGCPNGCDFCATSHYFKLQHLKLLPDGEAILGAIHALRAKHPGMSTFWLNDEDFLLDEARGRSFLEAIRRSNLPPLALSIFSSVKALSQYKASELVEMGIDWVWVGYEGQRAGYTKMQGRSFKELFGDLQAHGISVMASMIIGFDYQTPEIIQEEFEDLMTLRPSMTQYLIYGPTYGTPSYRRLKKEGRLIPEVLADTSKLDGFSLGFKHPHIGREEMEAIQRRLFRDDFERLGPSIYRISEDFLLGHIALRDHPVERVRAKAIRYGQDARASLKALRASKRYVSPRIGAWIERLRQRLIDETGPMTLAERAVERVTPALLWREQFKLKHDIGQQPEFTRRAYRMPSLWQEMVAAGRVPRPAPSGIGA